VRGLTTEPQGRDRRAERAERRARRRPVPGALEGALDAFAGAEPADATPSETTPAPPRGTRTVEIYKVSGLPKYGGPGWATGAECRSYADAMNALNDKAEENQKNGVDNLETFQQWDGIKKAGGARGCMFTQA
jgi:hypothetical protein